MFDALILNAAIPLTRVEYGALLSCVSFKKQEKVKGFHFFRDAQNCLLADILTRIEICRVTGLNNKTLEFSTNEYGKPLLVNQPNTHFNVSHSGHYVVCVIADDPVGIDIEIIEPIDYKIAERFFTFDETEYIFSVQGDLLLQRFFEIWTKKESRIKWEGQGLSKPLPSFSVFESSELTRIAYHNIFQNDDAICYICSTKHKAPAVRVINTSDLLCDASLAFNNVQVQSKDFYKSCKY